MKFTKSQRTIHANNYNPPPNVYQPDQLPNPIQAISKMNIVTGTGSLAGPSFITKNTFGYEPRFMEKRCENNESVNPGPGSYNIGSMKALNKNNNKSKQKILKGKYYPPSNAPSIPYNYYGQDIDEDQQRYIKQLAMSQNILKSINASKKKEPSFSFSKGQRTHSYLPRKIAEEERIMELENEERQNYNANQTLQRKLGIEESYLNYGNGQNMTGMKKTSVVWQEKIQKSTNRRLEVIQSLSPDFVPSLELIELMKRRKDKGSQLGPGSYHTRDTIADEGNYQFYQAPKGVSFTSVKRFETDKKTILGPGLYEPKKVQSCHKYSFGKTQRNIFPKKDPEDNFRFYINPIQQPNIQEGTSTMKSLKMRSRSQSTPFGSSANRFEDPVKEQLFDRNNSIVSIDDERKKKSKEKFSKMVKTRLILQEKRRKSKGQTQKDEGLLGISTMASTIE